MNNSSTTAEFAYEMWVTPLLVIYGLICLTSVVMNSLVVGTFCRYECLTSIHDRLIFALSSVNMILLLGVPFYLMYSIGYSFVIQNQDFCLLNFVILHGGIGCSVLLHLGLALDRYLCIVWPWKHAKIRKRYVIMYILFSYFFGFGVNLLPALGWNSWAHYRACVWKSFPWGLRVFVRVTMISILFLNLGIHLYVLHVANRHARKIRRLIKRIRRVHSRTSGCEHTAVTTVVLLAVISSICWWPYLTASFVLPPDKMTTVVILQILYAIIILNSVTSPLLFVMRNRHFRDAMCRLLILDPKSHHCGH